MAEETQQLLESEEIEKVPVLVVLSGPSGAGKSSLVNLYVEHHPRTCLVVSATTRRPRATEVPGKDYHFLKKAEFEAGIERDAFLEHAEVHGNYYGTPRDQVDAAMRRGQDVFLEIDVQGGRAVKAKLPSTVLAFLTPSTPDQLMKRLHSRGQDDPEVIQKRLKNAAREYQALREYDYWIVNDKLLDAYRDLRAVVLAEKCRLARHPVERMIADFSRGPAPAAQ